MGSAFARRLLEAAHELALDAANGAGVPLPVTATVQQLLQSCMSGMADIDFMSLLPRLRREAAWTRLRWAGRKQGFPA